MFDRNAHVRFRRGRTSSRPTGSVRILVLLCALSLTLWSCDNFDFYGLLGEPDPGPSGAPLAISPVSIIVTVNGTCTFTASGGAPPYLFSVSSGSGTIEAGTGIYTAPTAPSSDAIQVTDAAGGTVEARAVSVP